MRIGAKTGAKTTQRVQQIRREHHQLGARQVLIFLLAILTAVSVLGAPLSANKLAFAETDITLELEVGESFPTAEAAITATALNKFTTAGTAFITSDAKGGLPVIGVALHANTGTWEPTPTSFSYQWFSFDDPITGATTATYVPVIDDYCDEISVEVTAYRDDYEATTVRSDFVQPEPAGEEEEEDNGNNGSGGNTDGKKDSTDFRSTSYPWAPVAATGNYIKDNYSTVPTTHVFESVTQERLLDILSSSGDYYIVLSGPSRASSQKILSLINQQAQSAGITKIYHFDPLIDGYQADITKTNSSYRTSASINALWTRITDLLPTGEPIASYDLTDTLLFRYRANPSALGTRGAIPASYSFAAAQVDGFVAADERAAIDAVFRNGNAVVASSVRTDLQFFSRVYNAAATLVNSRMPVADYKVDAATITLFDGLTEANFKLHQINFVELQNLYNTPGEHIIFYGASWCHNTQAIIGTIAAQAARNPNIKTVYVYDTTLGNQVKFGTDASINKASAYSSVFNSRTGSKAGPTGDNNVSYIYGEAVRPLGNFLSENNTNRTGSIEFYANGDLSGSTPVSSVLPWNVTSSTPAASVNAIRLQLPFLVAYNKDSGTANKAVRQWLHKQTSAANEGKYLEYMLELAWVRAGQSTSAADAAAKGVTAAYESTRVFVNGGITNDEGLTIAQAGARATAQVKYVLQIKDDADDSQDSGETPSDDKTSNTTSTNTPTTESPKTTSSGAAPVTPVTYQQGAGVAAGAGTATGTGAGTSSAAETDSTSLVLASSGAKSSNSASQARQIATDIPEAATPLSDSPGVSATDNADFRLPLAVALLLTAIAIFAAIGIKTGFISVPRQTLEIPVPKQALEEGSV
jgi:hypothetical protein